MSRIGMVNFCNGKRRRENEMETVELEAEFISKMDVARMLSCSTKTVERRTEEGIFTAYEIGGLIRYKKSEVLEALKRKNK